MREKLVGDEEQFKTDLISWIASIISSEFATGTLNDVKNMCADIDANKDNTVIDPICKLPERAPEDTTSDAFGQWVKNFMEEVDKIVYYSNVHVHNDHCRLPDKKDGVYPCKARLPREEEPDFKIDTETGSLILKHTEPFLNSFCRLLAYLFKGNTTSFRYSLSGCCRIRLQIRH